MEPLKFFGAMLLAFGALHANTKLSSFQVLDAPPPVVEVSVQEKPFDADALAYAVAIAESSNCTSNAALTRNNCHGIHNLDGGLRTFSSQQASFDEFKAMWQRIYSGGVPTEEDARKYCPPNWEWWLATVTAKYNERVSTAL